MMRVVSRDGTEVAYWTSGQGPPLVVVHGTPADHTRWRPLLPYLEPHATVHAMDRRGRGASGDAPGYELAREYEDVAAVVDAAAEASGAPVDVYGHSHGGIVAFGAATLTPKVRRLVLYEGWPVPDPDIYALPPGLAATSSTRKSRCARFLRAVFGSGTSCSMIEAGGAPRREIFPVQPEYLSGRPDTAAQNRSATARSLTSTTNASSVPMATGTSLRAVCSSRLPCYSR